MVEVVDVPSEEVTEEYEVRWRWLTRILFRFSLLYFLLYTHPFPLSLIPNPKSISTAVGGEWAWSEAIQPFYERLDAYEAWTSARRRDAVEWVGANVLGIERELDRPAGSGDTTHNYIELLIHLSLAGLGCVAWSWLARRTAHHRRLAPWLHLAGRYMLAVTMFGYGLAKVIMVQFRTPDIAQLTKEFGDCSPMNLLWYFMGHSQAYTVFAGASEMLGGLLLLFRRTSMLGALVVVAVMTNVVAMNFCYDVPVKLYSSHLLLLALALLIPDVPRLYAMFFRNRWVAPRNLNAPRLGWMGPVFRLLIIGPLLLTQADFMWNFYRQGGPNRPKPPLYGLWDVTEYREDGEVIPPLTTDPVRWQNLIIDYPQMAEIRDMSDLRFRFSWELDDEAKSVTLTSETSWQYRFASENEVVCWGAFSRQLPPTDEGEEPRPIDPQFEMRMVRVESSAASPVASLSDSPETSRSDPSEAAADGDSSADSNSEDVGDERLAPWIGHWRVTSATVIGETLHRGRSDPFVWKSLRVADDGTALLTFAEGRDGDYAFAVKPDGETMVFSTRSTFVYEQPDARQLILRGDFRGHELEVQMRARDLQQYLLVRRGFHWVNEIPLNR